MEQHLAQFLSTLSIEKRYSANTISAYPADITTDVVEAYVEDLQHGSQPYAPSTVARKIAAVKSFFHWLSDQGTVAQDPAARLNSPKVKKHIPRTLSHADMERLLAAPGRGGGSKAMRDRALLGLFYATGMRVTEVVNLRLEDVSWETGFVNCPGKGERRRQIPMGSAHEPL